MIAIVGAPQVSQQFQDLQSAAAAQLQTGLWGAILDYHAQETGRLTARELPAPAATQLAENRNASRRSLESPAAAGHQPAQEKRGVEAQQHHEAQAPHDVRTSTEEAQLIAANVIPVLFQAQREEVGRETARAEREAAQEIRDAMRVEVRRLRASQRNAAEATRAAEAAQAAFVRVAAAGLPANIGEIVKAHTAAGSPQFRFHVRTVGQTSPPAPSAPAPRVNGAPRAPAVAPVASVRPQPCPITNTETALASE